MRKQLSAAALSSVLLSQTSCVGAVVAAANHREMEERAALKIWLASNSEAKDCGGKVTLAPVIYYDFDQDAREELIVNASVCSDQLNRANTNLVLSVNGDGTFTSWPIEELTKTQLAEAQFAANPHYRLSTKQGKLVATWMDDARSPVSPLTIKYQWDGQRFVVYGINYGK